ncbi:MAG: hypothetical protein JWN34_3215 [Bryobacterales bacterium]|nr:hypothetical protein [Bryobacterales bacterium]
MFTLKALSRDSIAGALAKAERYRLLNEPAAAESICRDILEIDSGNHDALVCLVLALSDQIAQDKKAWQNGLAGADKLTNPYERAYYSGIVWERRAKALFHEGQQGRQHSIYEWVTRAMDCFEEAEKVRPAGNDDAVLRWNTCARFLNGNPQLAPRVQEIPDAILSE